jgi:type II secretory pathway component PulM
MITGQVIGQWWQQRAPREKLVLSCAAMMLVLVILYLLIEPVLLRRAQLEADIPRLQEDKIWMQDSLRQLEQLRGDGSAPGAGQSVLTITLVEELLHAAGIHAQLAELKPASGQSVTVRFDAVAFSGLMEFLLQLRTRSNARPVLASISRIDDQDGMVEAALTLAPAGSP